MKKVLAGTIFLSLVLFPFLPVTAQKIKAARRAVKTGITPVVFSKFSAASEGNGVWIEWQTAQETNNLGFSIYKTDGGEGTKVNRGLIAGAYLETGEAKFLGKNYSFFDPAGDLNSTYYIESLNIDGKTYDSKTFSTGRVEDLTAKAGVLVDFLKNASATAAPAVVSEENILPSELQTEIRENASQPDFAKQLWVAAQPGVKFSVKKEGLYRVTRAQLAAGGFDLSAAPALWQLYVNGIEKPINVGGNGDFIEFFGRGIDTLEADAQTYYLVAGTTNGKRLGSTARRMLNGRVLANSYAQSVTKKERFIYSSSFLNGEKENFFGSVVNATGSTVNFTLTGIDFSSPSATIDVGIQGLTETAHQTFER